MVSNLFFPDQILIFVSQIKLLVEKEIEKHVTDGNESFLAVAVCNSKYSTQQI